MATTARWKRGQNGNPVGRLRNLLGKIDLRQIHEADSVLWWDDHPESYEEPYIVPVTDVVPGQAPVMDVVQEAKRLGVCSAIGVTANTARPLAEAVRRLPVDSVLCAYNSDPVFRGALEHVLPAARERGATLLAAGVLQGGCYINRDRVDARLLDWPVMTSRISRGSRRSPGCASWSCCSAGRFRSKAWTDGYSAQNHRSR